MVKIRTNGIKESRIIFLIVFIVSFIITKVWYDSILIASIPALLYWMLSNITTNEG